MTESDYLEFEWDSGNYHKSWQKHNVTPNEAEEIFANSPLIVFDDKDNSRKEVRYRALGKTNAGRKLFASFTYRNVKIRIISVRDMNKKERSLYDKEA